MTDRLDRALRAARDGETGESPQADETLARVLATGRAARIAWNHRARVWIPIAAVLAISSMALARTFLARRAEMVATSSGPSAPPVASVTSVPQPMDLPAPPAPTVEEPAPAQTASETPALTASLPAPPSPSSRVLAHKPPAPAPATDTEAPAATTALAPAPVEVSSEADVYTRAHRLHFDGDAAAALAAWDAYLVRYPDGRFVPDARYNRAIDLVKLRRYSEARAALQPFADGAFGGYHSGDAQRLLATIP
ncbi:MAG: hypothetical protein ACRENE_05805 [Polyangiaceae bacterium]